VASSPISFVFAALNPKARRRALPARRRTPPRRGRRSSPLPGREAGLAKAGGTQSKPEAIQPYCVGVDAGIAARRRLAQRPGAGRRRCNARRDGPFVRLGRKQASAIRVSCRASRDPQFVVRGSGRPSESGDAESPGLRTFLPGIDKSAVTSCGRRPREGTRRRRLLTSRGWLLRPQVEESPASRTVCEYRPKPCRRSRSAQHVAPTSCWRSSSPADGNRSGSGGGLSAFAVPPAIDRGGVSSP